LRPCPYRSCLPVVRRQPTAGRRHYYLETCRTQRWLLRRIGFHPIRSVNKFNCLI
jgi:hypothetical protein